MPVGAIERDIQDACVRLAESAAVASRSHEHYLDGLGGPPGVAGRGRDLAGPATALTAAHPWALGGFGEAAWDGYQPDPHVPPPDGLRVGLLRTPGGPSLPVLPAVPRFARTFAGRHKRPDFRARIEGEGVIDPFFGVPVLGPKEAGSSDSVYWPLLAR